MLSRSLRIAFALVLLVVGTDARTSPSSARSRRSLDQFGAMMECMTGKNPIEDYSGYGCYCGFGGDGEPVDETDRCCYAHDNCYEDAMKMCRFSKINVYSLLYNYEQSMCNTPEAKITCAVQYHAIQIQRDCAAALCECDATAAKCFAQALDTYDSKYMDWSNC